MRFKGPRKTALATRSLGPGEEKAEKVERKWR